VKKPLVVSVVNHKGGVGKTSTVVNLAAGLGLINKNVLVIDLDTQMNLTHSLIGDLPEGAQCISDVLTGDLIHMTSISQKTSLNGVEIAPAGESMVDLELRLHSAIGREYRLKQAIERACLDAYDFIIIDNGPHIGLATLNSLMASHCYLVPVSAEYLPMVGLRHLIQTIERIQPHHRELHNLGYLLTMVDRRESIAGDVEKILRSTFNGEVFDSVVRVNTKIKACPQKKVSIFDVETSQGRGVIDYKSVTDEFLKRVEGIYGT
jgi:chromosome partitioning protein